MKWEEVEIFYPALSPYSAFDLNLSGSPRRSPRKEGRRSRAPTVKAAIEASLLLRSVRKLRSELMKLRRKCDEIEEGV
jgi:uncharacterized protein (DUF2336 family)